MNEILESWEQIEESVALDKRLEALRLNTIEEEIESSRFRNTRMITLGEDGLRSQYVPPKPMVKKILKEPTVDSQDSGYSLLNDDKPKRSIKSLKQVCNLGCLSARDTW
ncbi:hypothetical protein ALC60_13548 [Trachymyrmex zeteki]|uniref:Uncharacterized protein n=1 Tax=Mycetomoellerius zeteki TaxID=64791 RepID=A0A151WHY2_9HYME|nr:hypothetical protein ALC60_13548 [Trachymyrmex zeteki]